MLAFTLIEVLVAIAVMSLLLVLVASITSNTANVLHHANNQMKSGGAASGALDTLERDLVSSVHGIGAWLIVKKGSGNDALGVFTQASPPKTSGIAANARLTAVGYSIRNGTDWTLGRDNSVGFTRGVFPVYETEQYGAPGNVPSATRKLRLALEDESDANIDFQTISPELVRLDISFILNNGRITQNPPRSISAQSIEGIAAQGFVVPALRPNDSSDPERAYVAGLVISVAFLDDSARMIVPTEDIEQIESALVDPDEGDSGMVNWNASVFSNPQIRKAIKFAQRHVSFL